MYMLYTKGYKYRIYPNRTQVNRIENIFGCCRFVFNYFLTYRRTVWRISGQSVNYVLSAKILTSLKKYRPYTFLASSDSMALQESLKDLDRAYQNFFDKISSYPNYKSKHFHKQSYRTRNVNNCIRVEGKHLILPKVGSVKIKLSRDFKGRILNATVSKTRTGKYFVSLCLEEELTAKNNSGGLVGIDVGLKVFYMDSNGYSVDSPYPLKLLEQKLVRQQRSLSRMIQANIQGYTKGRRPILNRPLSECRNIEKQRLKVARIHEKYHRVDRLHDSLYLRAEVGVARCVHDVDLVVFVHYGAVLGIDGDAALSFDGVGVHHAVHYLLVISEYMRLCEQRIHQSGFARVYVRYYSDVDYLLFFCHICLCIPRLIISAVSPLHVVIRIFDSPDERLYVPGVIYRLLFEVEVCERLALYLVGKPFWILYLKREE